MVRGSLDASFILSARFMRDLAGGRKGAAEGESGGKERLAEGDTRERAAFRLLIVELVERRWRGASSERGGLAGLLQLSPAVEWVSPLVLAHTATPLLPPTPETTALQLLLNLLVVISLESGASSMIAVEGASCRLSVSEGADSAVVTPEDRTRLRVGCFVGGVLVRWRVLTVFARPLDLHLVVVELLCNK